MHLHTFVDRERKRSKNGDEVVEHDVIQITGDPSTERTAPPRSAHVQLGDIPRTHGPVELGEEFRQHDGVVTMLMKFCSRASPKHHYSMTKVDYGGGGHRTRLKDPKDQLLLCLWGAPCPRI